MVIDSGCELDMEEMKRDLIGMGYERTGQVEGPGQFAVRGGILDIFPLTDAEKERREQEERDKMQKAMEAIASKQRRKKKQG
jgi:transcription-repair coupling factor (superfamily II helicase)